MHELLEPFETDELLESEKTGTEPVETDELLDSEKTGTEPPETDELHEPEKMRTEPPEMDELLEPEEMGTEPFETDELLESEKAGTDSAEMDELLESEKTGMEPFETDELLQPEKTGTEPFETDELLDPEQKGTETDELSESEEVGTEPPKTDELLQSEQTGTGPSTSEETMFPASPRPEAMAQTGAPPKAEHSKPRGRTATRDSGKRRPRTGHVLEPPWASYSSKDSMHFHSDILEPGAKVREFTIKVLDHGKGLQVSGFSGKCRWGRHGRDWHYKCDKGGYQLFFGDTTLTPGDVTAIVEQNGKLVGSYTDRKQ